MGYVIDFNMLYFVMFLEVHCGGGFYVRSLVRDIGIGKNLAYISRC